MRANKPTPGPSRIPATSERRPTPAEIAAARGRTVPDIIAPGLQILFCGINPSLYSAAVGHHFARPGNRFWPALFAGGLTDRLLHPSEETALVSFGYGITNIVDHATATANELSKADLIAGGRGLASKVLRYRPAIMAVLGISAYRVAFDLKRAGLGHQDLTLGGSAVWVLPNPSGLNAHYQIRELGVLFAELKNAAERKPSSTP